MSQSRQKWQPRVLPSGLLSLLLAASVEAGVVLDLAQPTDDVRMHGSMSGEWLSYGLYLGQGSMVTSDLDGDGAVDLVIASRGASPMVPPGTGAVRVIRGRFTSRTVADPVDDITALTVGGGSDEVLGASLAVGDLNGDGVPDLAIGAPGWNDGRGRAVVLFGPLPLDGTLIDLAASTPSWSVESGLPFMQLGWSLAVLDLNLDGVDDLVVGAPFSDSLGGARRDAGEVRVFFGPLLAGATLTHADSDVVIWGNRGSSHHSRPGDYLGGVMYTGDVDGDGHADLLLGSPTAAVTTISSQEGEVLAFLSPLTESEIDLAVEPADVHIVGRASPAGAVHSIGHALAVGDINADGVPDLILGAPAAAVPFDPTPMAGEVDILLGPFVAGTFRSLDTHPPDRILEGAAAEDWLGMSVALGDINGDGILDLVAGAPHPHFHPAPRAVGSVRVLFGPIEAGPPLVLNDANSDVTVLGTEVDDYFGYRLLAADLGGDAKDDLVIGAPFSSRPSTGATSAGSVHVLFGEPGNRPPTCVMTLPDTLACHELPDCGGRRVSLDGSASHDTDLDLHEHLWRVTCGSAVIEASGALAEACLPVTCEPCLVELTVVDLRGNSSTCSQALEIVDDVAPLIAPIAKEPVSLWSPNHRMSCLPRATWAPVISDGCDPEPTWRLVACTSNEPEDGLGDGHFEPDCTISADGEEACMRAERSGTGEGRLLTLWGIARDACGNESEPSPVGEVVISHDRRGRAR